ACLGSGGKIPMCISLSPDGNRLLMVVRDGRQATFLEEIDLRSGKLIGSSALPQAGAAQFMPDGKRFVLAQKSPANLSLFSVNDLTRFTLLANIDLPVGRINISPDGKLLTTADGKLKVWKVDPPTLV